MTVTAVLACGHLMEVPASTTLPDVVACPRSGLERDITSILEE